MFGFQFRPKKYSEIEFFIDASVLKKNQFVKGLHSFIRANFSSYKF